MSDEFVSGNLLAKRLGISEAMVRKHRKRGLFSPVRSGTNAGKYHLATAKAAFDANRDPDAAFKGLQGASALRGKAAAGGPVENSLTRVRTIQAGLKAQREELELERARGQVIAKSEVVAAILAVVTVVTERMDGAAAQIAPRVVGLTNVAEIERIARDVINAVRAEVACMADKIEVIADAQR